MTIFHLIYLGGPNSDTVNGDLMSSQYLFSLINVWEEIDNIDYKKHTLSAACLLFLFLIQ